MPVNAPRKSRGDNNNIQVPTLSYSPSSYSPSSYSSSRSMSPDPTFDSIINNSPHRKPTFSYIPIHKRRRSGGSSSMLLRSLSLNPLPLSAPQSFKDSREFLTSNSSSHTPEIPSTPNSFYSMTDSTEYTSFPNLDHFADECWTEVHVEKRNSISELEMESYDEMLVGGVRFQYS
ncbi:6123_t:CDS:1 [Dentiscutata heterogama]|uniref:6123_t:CDS:1 n=1 Tax=Dentiscutata heterogama TaxID=1316150 RepID=A0ACA9M2Q2_9GLOM|nr:6123_t:CDS:1 [Dentiscutata heterogama]